jgi:tetratricopeptide (TPR) repeat protein
MTCAVSSTTRTKNQLALDGQTARENPLQRHRNIWRLRGTARAEAGRWIDAVGDLERAFQLADRENPKVLRFSWYETTAAFLGAGDVVRYRERCAAELGRSVKVEHNPDDSLLRACCVIPAAVADYGPLLAATREARDQDLESSSRRRDYGMVLFRAGRFADAARELDEALKLEPNASDEPVLWLFLALSRKQRGDTKGARELLARTERWRKEFEAHEPSEQRILTGLEEAPWILRLQVELLSREAKGPP